MDDLLMSEISAMNINLASAVAYSLRLNAKKENGRKVWISFGVIRIMLKFFEHLHVV